jgi:hypothetical protein
MRGSWRDDEMADTKCSESRQDMDMTRAREEAMCGARGDRFGVTDTPLREGLPRATARPTLHLPGGRNLDRPRSSLFVGLLGINVDMRAVLSHSNEVVAIEKARDWDGSP